jgi:homoserine dehydrogenase
MRSVTIGILGLGNVGAGTLRLLQERRAAIEARLGAALVCAGSQCATSARARGRGRGGAADDDPHAVIDDPAIDVVVELVGGIEPARTLHPARRCAPASTWSPPTRPCSPSAARRSSPRRRRAGAWSTSRAPSPAGSRSFAACARASPATASTRSRGSSTAPPTYILDAMTRSGADFAEALRAAQAAGYAEADPTLDVGGGDAAHKLALLALVAFGARVDPHAIPTEGITGVSALDIRAAGELGY